jgi:hypothetical protein
MDSPKSIIRARHRLGDIVITTLSGWVVNGNRSNAHLDVIVAYAFFMHKFQAARNVLYNSFDYGVRWLIARLN